MSGIGWGIGRVRNNKARTVLVADEVAVAVVLLVGSAPPIRASLAARRPSLHPAGFYFSYQLSAISSLGGRPQVFPRE